MYKQGINCVDLNERNVKFIHTVKTIIKKCDEIKPDVVVTHHDVTQFKAMLMYLRAFKPEIKTIAYAHENGADILPLISLAEQLYLMRIRGGFMKALRKKNTLRI